MLLVPDRQKTAPLEWFPGVRAFPRQIHVVFACCVNDCPWNHVRVLAATPSEGHKRLAATMSTSKCWDERALAGYNDSYYGRYCASFAHQVVDGFAGPAATILDVGTGTGIVPVLLSKKFPGVEVCARLRAIFIKALECRCFPPGARLRRGACGAAPRLDR